jgi:hypothetical protein
MCRGLSIAPEAKVTAQCESRARSEPREALGCGVLNPLVNAKVVPDRLRGIAVESWHAVRAEPVLGGLHHE